MGPEGGINGGRITQREPKKVSNVKRVYRQIYKRNNWKWPMKKTA